MDDGSPLTDAAMIQSICRGQRHAEAYTDSGGKFSFEFGKQRAAGNGDVQTDSTGSRPAVTPSGLSTDNGYSSDCELRAVLPGFTSDSIPLQRYGDEQRIDVGRLVLHRIANVEGVTVSATTAAAPPQARKAYEKARAHEKKGKLDEAEKELGKAVSLYPNFAVAWVELGRLQAHSNRFDSARESFNHAIAADSKLVSPYQQLTLIAFQQKQWEELVNVTERLLQLNPISFPEEWYYNAVGNFFLHRLEPAESSARKSLEADLEHQIPQAEYLLATILMDKRDFSGAAEHFRSYLSKLPNAPNAENVRSLLADAERLSKPASDQK